jgi:outer membrane protein OmpA-like peptidoglycan-associated protein
MIRSNRVLTNILMLFLAVLIAMPFTFEKAWAQVKFDEVETLLEKAREEGAELLSPKSFRTAQDEYQKAVELRDKGKSLKDIEKRLEKAKQVGQSAINNIKLAEVTFAEVFPEREKAVRAGAEEFVPVEWAEVEKEFRETVISLEEGKVKRAKSMVDPLIAMYQSVELNAIKVDILDEAKKLSARLGEKVSEMAPITYQKGLKKIEEANRLLETNRYARDDAELLIREAEYELRHSRSLFERITEAREKDLESLMLDFESNLNRIAKGMDIEVQFDGDVKEEVAKLSEKASELQSRNRELSAALYSLKEEMAESQQLKESLQERLEEEARKKERLNRVQGLFRTSEVKVFRDEKSNVVLRLIGFTFPPGTDRVDPVYYDLLSRVQQALSMFSDPKVAIEGHTDSMGDENLNKALSQKRAEAIRKYLAANQYIDPSIMTAVGFGEERPIANNETEQGRALNRRVDIVIIPSD